MTTRTPALIPAALAASLILTGCGSSAPVAEPAASSPSAAPTASTSEPDAAARAVPGPCAALDLALGATLDGTALGACVAEALSSYGSGRMRLTTDAEGEIEFRYDPEYSFQGTMAGPAGEMSMVFVDGQMWIDQGSGPVKGDVQSEDFEAQMVGVTGELYRVYSDVRETAKLIQSQPTWTIAPQTEPVELPDGTTVESYRITSADAFTWNEIPVSEFVLWYGEDWVPTATQGTVAYGGMTGTQSQRFFDLGAPVTITPPA